MTKLLTVKNLKTYFYTADGIVSAVDGVDFDVASGETLGIVGESGCGKSVTAMSVLGLISEPGRIISGDIMFDGKNLRSLDEKKMCSIRGNDISMIFQEAMTSLNPVFTVGDQIGETIKLHQKLNNKQANEKAVDMLRLVGIPLPERRVKEYPHQLSGGMRQRVMIAMALSGNPKLLFADEPTTALDVTIQAQILELMKKLRSELDTAIVLITHDLGVIAEMVDRVIVMYAGKVVEEANVYDIFREPLHPYTEGLLNSIPRLDEPKSRLKPIQGVVPNPLELPEGCSFHPRCPYAMDICKEKQPQLKRLSANRQASCWLRSGGGNDGNA